MANPRSRRGRRIERIETCDLCMEETSGTTFRINGSDSPPIVCAECARDAIVPALLRACHNELDFPPRWGNQAIQWAWFHRLLPDDFQQTFEAKSAEFQVPLAQRIYCKNFKSREESSEKAEECGAYLGTQWNPDLIKCNYKCKICEDPTHESCAACGLVVTTPVSLDFEIPLRIAQRNDTHPCEQTADDLANAFNGLVLGSDYQICPGCQMKIELSSGCNAVVCPRSMTCGISYCSICGMEAMHDSGHWDQGNPCPRWNKPGDHNAHFDVPQAPAALPAMDRSKTTAGELSLAQAEVQMQMRDWRNAPGNVELVRQETYLNTLHETVAYDPERFQYANKHPHSRLEETLLALLHNVQTSLSAVAAYRYLIGGTTARTEWQTTQDMSQKVKQYHWSGEHRAEFDRLIVLVRSWLDRIPPIWESISEEFKLKNPRLVSLVQQTLDRLCFFAESQHVGPVDAVRPDSFPLNPDLTDYHKLGHDFRRVISTLQRLRVEAIEGGTPRSEALSPALEMLSLMYDNLQITSYVGDGISSPERSLSQSTQFMQHYSMCQEIRFWEQHFEADLHRSRLRKLHPFYADLVKTYDAQVLYLLLCKELGLGCLSTNLFSLMWDD